MLVLSEIALRHIPTLYQLTVMCYKDGVSSV